LHNLKPGKFITFEGGEGAGKTTLIQRIYEALSFRGYDLLKTRAPGGTAIGESIREILLHKQEFKLHPRCELLLFLADRAQHVEEVILPALENKKVVLCDRYNDSTEAYQGGARGLPGEQIRELCNFACNKLQPDLTLYLDIDPTLGFARQKKMGNSADRIESETLAFHTKIRAAFHKIAEREPNRFRLVDASRPIDEVLKEALAFILPLLKDIPL